MTHRIGDYVPYVGRWRCTNCGNTLELEAKEEFPQCEVCFAEDQGEWELVDLEPLGPAGGVEM